MKFYVSGSPNWYLVQELYFLSVINSPDFQVENLVNIYSTAFNHVLFKSLETTVREKWHIYGGYLWFILTLDNRLNERNILFHGKNRFDLYKLSENISLSTKDKKGGYISFIILQMLINLQDKKLKSVERSVETLKNYLGTYMTRDKGRGRNMMRLLVITGEQGGKLYKNLYRVPRLVKAIDKTERFITSNQIKVEVINYSTLWRLVEVMLTGKVITERTT